MDAELQAVTREKLVADMRTVLADTELLLKAVVGQSGEKLAALQPRIEESLRRAKAQLAEFEQAASEKARATAQATDDYAHEHPWRIAGTTALLGVAVGLLIGRR
ncbi:MAG: DUF883 family protein [Sterolibacterium sp.]|jgi:ElaB/YqjD/DUF883 family membrane-anchored ribosome-binding protein